MPVDSPNTLRSILSNPIVLPIYLPAVVFSFSLSMLIPVMPLYVASFDVSYGIIGLVLAGQGLGMLLSDVPAGILLRWFGVKQAMLMGVGCVVFFTLALFWAGSVPEAFLYRLVAGFGMALYNVSRHSYMADMVTIAGRGRAIALLGGINRIGSFAGPVIGGTAAAIYGMRAPFLIFGATCSLVLIVVAFFVRIEKREIHRNIHIPESIGNPLLAILKTQYRVLVAAGTGQLFAQMIRAGRAVIIPLYAADIIGLDIRAIGLIISIAAAIDMLLFYPAGIIMDRYGRKFAIIPSFFLQAIGMSLVPFTGSFIGLMAAAALVGFGNGLGSGVMMTLGADLSPRDLRGEFLGVWRFIGDSGFTGAPLVIGGIADIVGLQLACWTMAGAGLTAVIIFLRFVPETLKRHGFIQPSS